MEGLCLGRLPDVAEVPAVSGWPERASQLEADFEGVAAGSGQGADVEPGDRANDIGEEGHGSIRVRCTHRSEGVLCDVDAVGPCRCKLETMSRSIPNVMDPGFQDAIEQASEHHMPGAGVRMPSAAGHDAQILAQRMPAGMLFVPSIGGVSHHWSEDTKDEDIVLGCQVLASAAVNILRS